MNTNTADSLRLLTLDALSAARNHPCIWLGPPAAYHADLLAAMQLLAVLRGRGYVTEEDLRLVLLECVPHQLTVRVVGQEGVVISSDGDSISRNQRGSSAADGSTIAGSPRSRNTICPTCSGLRSSAGSRGDRSEARDMQSYPLRAMMGSRAEEQFRNSTTFGNYFPNVDNSQHDFDDARSVRKGILNTNDRSASRRWLSISTNLGEVENIKTLTQSMRACECKTEKPSHPLAFQDIFYSTPSIPTDPGKSSGNSSNVNSQQLLSRTQLDLSAAPSQPRTRVSLPTILSLSDLPADQATESATTERPVAAYGLPDDFAAYHDVDPIHQPGEDASGAALNAKRSMSRSAPHELRNLAHDRVARALSREPVHASAWMRIVDSDEEEDEDEDCDDTNSDNETNMPSSPPPSHTGTDSKSHNPLSSAVYPLPSPLTTVTLASPQQRLLVAAASIAGDRNFAAVDALLRGHQARHVDMQQRLHSVLESALFAVATSRDEFTQNVLRTQVSLIQDTLETCASLSHSELKQLYQADGVQSIEPGRDLYDPYFIFRTRKYMWWRESVARAVVTYIVDRALVGPLYTPF